MFEPQSSVFHFWLKKGKRDGGKIFYTVLSNAAICMVALCLLGFHWGHKKIKLWSQENNLCSNKSKIRKKKNNPSSLRASVKHIPYWETSLWTFVSRYMVIGLNPKHTIQSSIEHLNSISLTLVEACATALAELNVWICWVDWVQHCL